MGNEQPKPPPPHVDILCVVDGESLLRDYPDTADLDGTGDGKGNRKVFHGAGEIQNYCRMITRDRSAKTAADQDLRGAINHHTVDAALVVRAKVGNVVRWRATSLTLDDEYRVDIEDFYNTGSRTWQKDICAKPEPEPYGEDEDPKYFWLTEIVGPGTGSYWLKFRVRKLIDDPQEGHFDWDPGIQAEA